MRCVRIALQRTIATDELARFLDLSTRFGAPRRPREAE
jgi:hypothetical protein